MSRSCNPDEYLVNAELVLREDLEGLMRTYSTEERVELWNKVREDWKRYLIECSPQLPRDVDRLCRGKFRFAQLMLAATFKFRGEGFSDVVNMFRDEEYEILRDFEEFKVLDRLSIEEIVEFIRRREGRVYEVIRKYYDRQYNMLDRSWGRLIGDLALIINSRYRERRRKIEEAVMEYARRYGVSTLVSEVEEAVRKAVEAGRLRERVLVSVSKALKPLSSDELSRELEGVRELRIRAVKEVERLWGRPEGVKELEPVRKELISRYEGIEELIADARRELEEAIKELSGKEGELLKLISRYGGEAAEVLKAEAELIKDSIRRLKARINEYESLINRLRAERDALELRLKELEDAVKGVSGGHLVSIDEARAFEELVIRRFKAKALSELRIYSPVKGGWLRVKGWDEVIHYSLFGDYPPPNGRSLKLVRRSGILRRREVVLEVINALRAGRLVSEGWDSRPLGLAELLDLVSVRSDEAEGSGYYHVLIISSPTGFTGRVKEYVRGGFGRSFTSKNLTLYLLDPVTGELVFNDGDQAAVRNRWVASLELPGERVERVKKYVLSRDTCSSALKESPAAPFILVEDVVKATGEELWVVRRALSELEEAGYGKVLRSASGATAFFYSDKALRGG